MSSAALRERIPFLGLFFFYYNKYQNCICLQFACVFGCSISLKISHAGTAIECWRAWYYGKCYNENVAFITINIILSNCTENRKMSVMLYSKLISFSNSNCLLFFLHSKHWNVLYFCYLTLVPYDF